MFRTDLLSINRGLNTVFVTYSLIDIGFSSGGSITVHIYTQTIQRKTQITTEEHK